MRGVTLHTLHMARARAPESKSNESAQASPARTSHSRVTLEGKPRRRRPRQPKPDVKNTSEIQPKTQAKSRRRKQAPPAAPPVSKTRRKRKQELAPVTDVVQVEGEVLDPDDEPALAPLLGSESTQTKKLAFLEAFAKTGIVVMACEELQLPRRTVYFWRDSDPEFKRRYDEDAMAEAIEMLERAAWIRATEGVQRIKRRYDRQTGELLEEDVETRYSDGLLETLLRARAPGKYNTERMEHSGPGGGDIPVKFTVNIRRPIQERDD